MGVFMFDNKKVAVEVSGVKKMYRLGQIGGGSLQADLQSWLARKRGKEDPNTKIGEDKRSNGKTFMALNGVDLTIYQGEAIGIIGSNGAGKSTLLKLLSRVTAPTEGEIDIYGRIASMLEVGTGFNKEMTGRENIYLNGAILGMTKAEIDMKMEDIISFSEVREFIDTPVKRYSSGMFVKLAFSVAAHLDSEIMIMDEVLAVGDMAFQKKCLTKMREAAKTEGRTVLYVSHNMNTIRQLCDRCIVLDKGKVAFIGGVEEAIEVYLGQKNDYGDYLDLKDYIRNEYLPQNNCIRITSCRYSSFKKDNDQNELKIRLTWENYDCNQDIYFRLEFSANGLGVATTMTSVGVSPKYGEILLSVNTSLLVPAIYNIVLVAYHKIDNNSMDIDIVDLIPYKKVVDSKIYANWNKNNWGFVKLDDIVIDK